jgi:hypothetical protein
LTANIQAIAKITKAPVFLVGDLLQGGRAHGEELLDCLSRAGIENEVVFEFFAPPPKDFLQRIDDSVKNWSIEVSPDSHDPGVRRSLDRKPFYENATMEAALHAALALRCHRIDVFYLIGIPHQTHQSVLDTVTYCEHLFRTTDKRLSCFISPVGPGAVWLPLFCADAGGASATAGPALVGIDPELRNRVDDPGTAGGRNL